MISSAVARSTELSGTAFKILQILTGKPDGWQPNTTSLMTEMKEGRYAIQRALTELKQLGHLVCRSVRDALGRFLRFEWDIYEIPVHIPGDRDVHGNIVEFDHPQKKSRNLRREAKDRHQKDQNIQVERQSETPTASTSDPYTGFPHTGFQTGSNIDTSNIYQDLERDGEAFNILEEEILTTEECASESSVEPQVFVEDFGCEQDGRSDKYSATAEFDEDELSRFKTQLENLGKNLGRHSPLGWAFAIVQNLREGKASTYWEEFKAGVPLGTFEQREWEIEPGVPCSIVRECLKDYYRSKPGATDQEAAVQAGRSLAKPKQMQELWQSIKERVMFLKREADRLSELGVENSTIVDPWMKPKQEITVEEFSGAIATLQGSVAPAQIEAAAEKNTEKEGTAVEELPAPGEADPYAPTPESLAARERARSLLNKRFGRPTKAEEFLAANISEIEEFFPVKPLKAVIVEESDEEEPILW
jgi:hypothetical protein